MTGLRHQTQITLGFVPLLDASPLIVAHAKGFALKEGLDLRLLREMSWAALRDRISIGHIDAAHMPAPLPIATTRLSLCLQLNANALAPAGSCKQHALHLYLKMPPLLQLN